MRRAFVVTIILLPSIAAAQDSQRGHEIAQRWCSSCHMVEHAAAAAPANGLPTFPGIAANPGLSPDRLRAAMNQQHGRMPDFALSRQQEDDLIGYVYSLRAR